MTSSNNSSTTSRSIARAAAGTLLAVSAIALLPAGSVNAGVDAECEFDAIDDNYSTSADVALTIVSPGIFTNDLDCGYDLFGPLLGQPANGSVAWGGSGNFVYTPNSGFTGFDTFEYQIYYNDGESTVVPSFENNPITATVTIEVTGSPAPTTEAPATTVVAGSGGALPETGSTSRSLWAAAGALFAAGLVARRAARRPRTASIGNGLR